MRLIEQGLLVIGFLCLCFVAFLVLMAIAVILSRLILWIRARHGRH